MPEIPDPYKTANEVHESGRKLKRKKPVLFWITTICLAIAAVLVAGYYLSAYRHTQDEMAAMRKQNDELVRERDKWQIIGARLLPDAAPDKRLDLLSQRLDELTKRLPEEHSFHSGYKERLTPLFAKANKGYDVLVLKILGGSPEWFKTANEAHAFLKDVGFTNAVVTTDLILGGTPSGVRLWIGSSVDKKTHDAFLELVKELGQPANNYISAQLPDGSKQMVSSNSIRLDFGE